MKLFKNNLVLTLIFLLFLGCESKDTYNIESDKAIADLTIRIKSLEEDLSTLKSELTEVQAVLNDKDIDLEIKNSIRKEVHEGEDHKKEISQWVAYLKVQRKQRFQSLLDRKDSQSLKKEAEKEVADYFQQKELKPIKKPWLERYRTAIEL